MDENEIGKGVEIASCRNVCVLYEHIGVTNTIRFIHQFSQGQGDYTQERDKLFEGKSREGIMKGIRAMD